MTLRPANEVADEITTKLFGRRNYRIPEGTWDKHRDRIFAALTAREREVKDAVIDEAISICATWLANFENLTIRHTSATKYASATVKDIAENIQSIRTRIAALGTEEKTT